MVASMKSVTQQEHRQRARKEKCTAAAQDFYRAGIRYITALDEFIDEQKMVKDVELDTSREHVRVMESFLHRLFPDEFADTSSAAE